METFTISIFTEDRIGMLNRITIIFTRRYLNIESITASESELPGVFRYTIMLSTTEEMIKKVVGQIEKQIDVLKAFYHRDDDIIYQEIGMFKLRTERFLDHPKREEILKSNQVKILALEKEFIMIEKTGFSHEINALHQQLKPMGVLEFARSGRVAISKPMKTLEEYLNELN